MKEKIIKTDKATLLVVELPEGSKNVRVNNARGIFGYTDKINIVRWEALEFGNLQLIGRLPDITEEQAVKTVDESIHSGLYAHYVKEVNPPNVYRYRSSRDSLHTLLQANEIYFDNPLGETIGKAREDNWILKHEWQETQSKVWDKERTYLFIKVD